MAVLLAAFLQPVAGFFARHGVARGLATVLAMMLGTAVVAGLLTFVVFAVQRELPRLGDEVGTGVARLRDWLRASPWHVGDQQLELLLRRGEQWLDQHQQALLSGTLGVFGTLTEAIAGGLLAIVTLALVLSGGPRMWSTGLRLVRPAIAGFVDEAGTRRSAASSTTSAPPRSSRCSTPRVSAPASSCSTSRSRCRSPCWFSSALS
ncbi:AI-2E family transporter [Amycolatopsis sp. FDAARGOS 1241]|uniref:AI-2E family transporter n=1 Tax=Amycolatopsis sp. FDAARGOS 1241 TaxID=2778070 RepID=UPI00194E5F04|nr:AI-2E family transporter [Amycolatopsis sp. FDAARGOS 1241]QRP50084.1 AI-2E family transporter [Amycolatopsis sp. FDAARGOS 1241]